MKTKFGVSLEEELLTEFDRYIEVKNLPNRSEALGYLVKRELNRVDFAENEHSQGFASVTICFDHHKSDIGDQLTGIQHDFLDVIKCSQHLHVNHDLCAEVILCLGAKDRILDFYKQICSVRSLINHNLYFYGQELGQEIHSHSH